MAPGVPVHINGTDDKTTLGKFESYGDVWWDGNGQIVAGNNDPGNSASFWNYGSFYVDGGQNPTVVLSAANSMFVNMGNFTGNSRGTRVSFGGDGWVQNFGWWEVSGSMAIANSQNSGVIQVDGFSPIWMGYPGGRVILSPLWSPTGQSIIQGTGWAYFLAPVTLDAGTVQVGNVVDRSGNLSGAGTLQINGTYEWDAPTGSPPGSVTTWAGPGDTLVGSDTNRAARLVLTADNFTVGRDIRCYGTIDWTKTAAPGTELNSQISLYLRRIIIMAPGALGGGAFNITGNGVVRQRIVLAPGALGTERVTNGGTITATPGRLIQIPWYNELPTGKFDVKPGTSPPSRVEVPGHTQFAMGEVDVESGGVLVFLDGLDMADDPDTGGVPLINNAGELDILGGFNLAGGTVNCVGDGVDQVTTTVDQMAQSGGSVNNQGLWTTTATLALSGGSFTTQPAAPASGLAADTVEQTGGDFYYVAYADNLDIATLYSFDGGNSATVYNESAPSDPGLINRLVVNAPGYFVAGSVAAPAGVYVSPAGQLTIGAGTLTANVVNDGEVDAINDSIVAGDFTDNGTLHLGQPLQIDPADAVTITGSFTQTAAGTLKMDVTGTGIDLLQVGGTAYLNGVLSLQVDGIYTPVGQVGLVTYQSRIGQFASIAAAGLPGVSTAFYDIPYPGVMGIWNTWS